MQAHAAVKVLCSYDILVLILSISKHSDVL